MCSDDDERNGDELSAGEPLPSSWTPVDVLEGASRIRDVRCAINEISHESAEDETFTRTQLNEWIKRRGDGRPLSADEFNAVMVGLEECSVAAVQDTRGATYAESDFRVDVQPALNVLDKWQVAARYDEVRSERSAEDTPVRLVATLPSNAPARVSRRVDRTAFELRQLVVQAQDSVRIAAPYFDPAQKLIEDLASLPDREVSVRLLTREAMGEDRDSDKRRALERVADQVSPSVRHNFAVRDLYATDATGAQRRAVHAKTVIVDQRTAYVGSANFTRTGLGSNFELGALLTGPIVDDIVVVYDEMFELGDRVSL